MPETMFKYLVLLGMVGLLAFVRASYTPPETAFASAGQTGPLTELSDFSLAPPGSLPPVLPIDLPGTGNGDGDDAAPTIPAATPPPDNTPVAPAAHAGQAEPAPGPAQDSSAAAQRSAPPASNTSDDVAGSHATHAGQAEPSSSSGLAPAPPPPLIARATATQTPAAPPTPKPAAVTTVNNPAPPPATSVPAGCPAIAGQSYGALAIRGGPVDRPAAVQADLNLGVRGWQQVNAPLGLINLGGPTDGSAPRFSGLFAPRRMPRLTAAYQVYNWNFGANRRTTPIGNPAVTLLGLATAPGELILLPNAGYDIGSGYAAMVLYAERTRLTLKYTREDNVAVGYTLHLENVCVEPRLLGLYWSLNGGGRRQLPVVRNGQPLGTAAGGQLLAGIQDSGTWMDPRSRKDWWQ